MVGSIIFVGQQTLWAIQRQKVKVGLMPANSFLNHLLLQQLPFFETPYPFHPLFSLPSLIPPHSPFFPIPSYFSSSLSLPSIHSLLSPVYFFSFLSLHYLFCSLCVKAKLQSVTTWLEVSVCGYLSQGHSRNHLGERLGSDKKFNIRNGH